MSHQLTDLVTVKESDIHGKGLFAKINIKKDTVIGTLEGKVCKQDGPHVLWMNDGQDKFKVTNDLKFINHHKKANVAYYDDFTVVALKNIKAGQELLHDYGDGWE
ncbi:MAG: SET domain-containing protein-lysine N-methyltransferase [Gammaproteobacteria bacterium]|nr:SET domain-containing protein-lysine N-methyltransferase [Gammaproteobacteria bacterium]